MKKLFLLLLINIVLVLFQTAFLPDLLGRFYVPNLVLALGLALLIVGAYERSFLSVLLGGIIFDFVANKTPGLSSVVLISLLLLSHYLRRVVFRNIVYVFILGTLLNLAYTAVVISIPQDLYTQVFLGSLITGLFCVIITSVTKTVFAESKF